MIDLLVDILHFPWTTYLVVFTISSFCTYVIVSAINHERKEQNRLRRSTSAVSSEHDTLPDWYWYDGQTEPDERVNDWRTKSP